MESSRVGGQRLSTEPEFGAVTHSDVGTRSSGRRRTKRLPLWAIISAIVILAIAAWISVATADSDSGSDLLGLARSTALDIRHLRAPYLAAVIALAGLHYVATAVAARAAAGLPLPIGETLLVQLAAAAANRLTPAGVGGAALTARYFSRRGLAAPAAVGAVTALAVLGGLADLLVLSTLVLIGSSLGLHGSAHEVALLTRQVTARLGPARSPWLWAVVVVFVLAVLAGYLVRGRSRPLPQWARVEQPFRRLAHHPGALATLVLASGCTTLVLGFAFIATTAMVPGPRPVGGLGALLIAFMLGSAAATAVPLPAGLGSSEAAFVAVLISVQIPPAHAVEEVVIFRLLTFWAPAAAGVLAAGHLYRRDAL